MSPDPVFGIYAQTLSLRSERMQVLSDNLANADTPGFKARDFDFATALQEAGGSGFRLRTTHPAHLGGAESGVTADLKYRVPFQPSLDGNTVEAEVEQAAFGENAVQYQAALTFLNGKIQTLLTAITGGR